MDRETWWTIVHGVIKIWTRLSMNAPHVISLEFRFTYLSIRHLHLDIYKISQIEHVKNWTPALSMTHLHIFYLQSSHPSRSQLWNSQVWESSFLLHFTSNLSENHNHLPSKYKLCLTTSSMSTDCHILIQSIMIFCLDYYIRFLTNLSTSILSLLLVSSMSFISYKL